MGVWLVYKDDDLINVTSTQDGAKDAVLQCIVDEFFLDDQPLSPFFDNFHWDWVTVDADKLECTPVQSGTSWTDEYVLSRRPDLTAEQEAREGIRAEKWRKLKRVFQKQSEFLEACRAEGMMPPIE